MKARGEPRTNLPADSGEIFVQQRVIAATGEAPRLTVLDVGANLGQWTTQFLSLLPAERRQADRLRLHAFEPVPETRAALEARLRETPGGDIPVLEARALSNEIGEAQMAVMGALAGTNSLAFDPSTERRAERFVTVPTTTLAAFIEETGIDRVQLLKCDAEGYDFNILSSGGDLFAADRIDVAQFEYNHTWIDARCFLKDVFHFVDAKPYRVARIRPDHLELYDGWHPELERFFEANYAIVHERALDWFEVRRGAFDGSNTYA